MKMFKRVLAAGAALMMAVTGMIVSARAYEYPEGWYLNYASAPGMPSSAYHYNISRDYQPLQNSSTYYFRSFKEICSSFSSNQAPNGTRAKARYWSYIITPNGTVTGSGFGERFHETTDSYEKHFNLGGVVDFYHILRVKYELINPYSVACSMSGTYKISTVFKT